MKRKTLLMILLLALLTSCRTTKDVGLRDIDVPTLDSVRPTRPVLITAAESTSDLISNYNAVVGYTLKLESYIDSLEQYNKDIRDVLIKNDL